MRLFPVLAACALLAMPSVASAQGQKFAYINSQALLQNAPGRAEAEASFEKDMVGIRAQLSKLQDSLNAMNPAALAAYADEGDVLVGEVKVGGAGHEGVVLGLAVAGREGSAH